MGFWVEREIKKVATIISIPCAMILFCGPPSLFPGTFVLCHQCSDAKKSTREFLKLWGSSPYSRTKHRILWNQLQFSKRAELHRKDTYARRLFLTMEKGDEQKFASPEEERLAKKREEVERLRAAEKFIRKDEGKFGCPVCDYVYEPSKGDSLAGIQPGTSFEALPDSFRCPVCRSPKDKFVPRQTVIAGFATNQSYGLGTNSLTPGQKNALIFGGLFLLFVLLLAGYGLG